MPQPPPGPPGYAPGYQPSRSNGLSTASLVLGIIGIPLCFLFVPSVLAVVFGGIGLNQIKNDPGQTGRGKAIAGIIMGSVMLALFALILILGESEFTFE